MNADLFQMKVLTLRAIGRKMSILKSRMHCISCRFIIIILDYTMSGEE